MCIYIYIYMYIYIYIYKFIYIYTSYAFHVTCWPINHLCSAQWKYKCFEFVKVFETCKVLCKQFGEWMALSITVRSFLQTVGSLEVLAGSSWVLGHAFWILRGLWLSLWHPWGFWGVLGSAVGRPWDPLGEVWGSSGTPWDVFGCPWESIGAPWGPFRTLWLVLKIVEKLFIFGYFQLWRHL